MKNNKDKLNTKAILEAGEVEHYTADFFKLHGSKGGKKGSKIRWSKSTKEERQAFMAKVRKGLTKE